MAIINFSSGLWINPDKVTHVVDVNYDGVRALFVHVGATFPVEVKYQDEGQRDAFLRALARPKPC